MKKTLFELMTANVELRSAEEIKHGCADLNTSEPDKLASFDTEEAALEALAKYHSTATRYSGHAFPYWLVTEYWVEENEYTLDEDGEIEDCTFMGTCGYAPFDQIYNDGGESFDLEDFVLRLYENSDSNEEIDLKTAQLDLDNFRADGWSIPEELTAQEYMDEWNSNIRITRCLA